MAENFNAASFENILNLRSETGNINVHGVQIGCSRRTITSINVQQLNGTIIYNTTGSSLNVLRDENSSIQAKIAVCVKETLNTMYGPIALPLVSWMKGEGLPLQDFFIPLQMRSNRRRNNKKDDDDDCSDVDEDEIEEAVQNARSRNGESLRDIFTTLALKLRRKYYTKSLNPTIKLENIFDDNGSNDVRRILIESQAGYGKTTLVHRIMHDWVVKKDYIRHFEFAILLPLRELEQSVKTAIVEIINLRTDDDERVWEVINNDKTLLLLDGLDEISEADRLDVLKMLYDKSSFKMTIIVTCRIGLFALKDEERIALFRGVSKSDAFWTRKLQY